MALKKYILFNKYDIDGAAVQINPHSIVSVTTKKASDDSTVESGLSLTKDTTHYADGHYYAGLNELLYIDGVSYYLEVVVEYIDGAPNKTLKKYFTPQSATYTEKAFTAIEIDKKEVELEVD